MHDWYRVDILKSSRILVETPDFIVANFIGGGGAIKLILDADAKNSIGAEIFSNNAPRVAEREYYFSPKLLKSKLLRTCFDSFRLNDALSRIKIN